jgi:hypothetical protein
MIYSTGVRGQRRIESFSNYVVDLTKTDTLPIKYLSCNMEDTSAKTELLKKKGWVVKYHAEVPRYLRHQNWLEDIVFLEADKKTKVQEDVVYYIIDSTF